MNFKLVTAAAALALTTSACMTYNDGMEMDDDTVMMDDDGMSATTSASANTTVTVGGAAMYPTYNIVQNAQNSPIHTTLVDAVLAADLAATLSGPGPFTVFAPTNDAFSRVPEAALNNLMMPENKTVLARVLKYHVVPGRVTAADLMARINAGGGSAMLETAAGEMLTATMVNGDVKLAGENGTVAYVTQADVMQSNGIIHVVNGVLSPGGA